MASTRTKVHHPFVSYLLMATFVIQVLFVGVGLYPANSAETLVALFFFLEGTYFYKRQGYVGEHAITYAQGAFQQIHIPYKAVKKVRLSAKSVSGSSSKGAGICFVLTTKDGGEHKVPITPRLVEQLRAHKIKVPNLKEISYFKLRYPTIDKFMVLEIILLLIIWTTRLKTEVMISATPAYGYQVVEGIFGFLTGFLLIYFLHLTTFRATFNNGRLRVRGFGAVRQDLDIKQITKAQIKDRGPFRIYKVYAKQRRVLMSGYLSEIGTLYALLAWQGVTLDTPRENAQQKTEVSEIEEK